MKRRLHSASATVPEYQITIIGKLFSKVEIKEKIMIIFFDKMSVQ